MSKRRPHVPRRNPLADATKDRSGGEGRPFDCAERWGGTARRLVPVLRRRPGTSVVRKMIDWEASTGGYLLAGNLQHRRPRGDGGY